MNISIDYVGTYIEHKIFFDIFADVMQKAGHRVGIITGEREVDIYGERNIKEEMLSNIGFKPDFVYMWGQTETIANGALWKAQKMDKEDILIHFDDDGTELKRYTGRWVLKTMDSGNTKKF